MDVKQFFVEGLGHASYLLTSEKTKEAAVVDPRRDLAVYVAALHAGGLRLRYVLETHTHNDYISGARPLAEAFGAEYVASADAGLRFPFRGVREGDELRLGQIKVSVLATPGHTPEHVSYVVADTARAQAPAAVFSGGDLLVGGVGRTDLLGPELGRELAPRLHESLHGKLLRLDDYVEVYPTHGGGSLCGKGTSSKRTTTVGYERRFSPLLQIDKEEFVRQMLANDAGIPAYYQRMRPANQEGLPRWTTPEPQPLRLGEVRRLREAGATVVDTRGHLAFGAAHIPGAINVGLESVNFATWVGWLVPADRPIVLVLDSAEGWTRAVTSLALVGYDRMAGYLQPGMGAWLEGAQPVARVPQRTVSELREQQERGLQVLDVRAHSEWDAGHLEGALHVPLGELEGRVAELDPRRPTAVLCASGLRSSVGASLLLRRGFVDVYNVPGGMTAWRAARYPTVSAQEEVEERAA